MTAVAELKRAHRVTWAAGDYAAVAELIDDAPPRDLLARADFAGPTWEARDGSKVVATRVDGVPVDAGAIDWLLLSAVSTTRGPDGDRLTRTTYIQRTATTGGLAPAAANCNATTAGTAVEVPYTADYHFWRASRSP